MTADVHKNHIEGSLIAYDEVRCCPICHKEVYGFGIVKCEDHFVGYSAPNLQRTYSTYEPPPEVRPLLLRHASWSGGMPVAFLALAFFLGMLSIAAACLGVVEISELVSPTNLDDVTGSGRL